MIGWVSASRFDSFLFTVKRGLTSEESIQHLFSTICERSHPVTAGLENAGYRLGSIEDELLFRHKSAKPSDGRAWFTYPSVESRLTSVDRMQRRNRPEGAPSSHCCRSNSQYGSWGHFWTCDHCFLFIVYIVLRKGII
jgi:hypothetical protein